MHRTDEERPAGERPASHVHVRWNTGMAVDDVSVLMKVCGAGRALAGRLADGTRTKGDASLQGPICWNFAAELSPPGFTSVPN